MMTTLRQIMFGPPLPTHRAAEERLSNFQALASIAYANQEIFLGLVVAGAAGHTPWHVRTWGLTLGLW